MIAPILLLAGAFLLLGILLIGLNLDGAWRWPVKAAAIVLTALATAGVAVAIESLLGRPAPAAPPERFALHAAVVEEPGRGQGTDGAVFLWLSRKDQEGLVQGPPRAHALPYSRELHEQITNAQSRLDAGRAVEGATRRSGSETTSPTVELFDAPVAALPAKIAE